MDFWLRFGPTEPEALDLVRPCRRRCGLRLRQEPQGADGGLVAGAGGDLERGLALGVLDVGIGAGADPNVKNAQGQTALEIASSAGYEAAVGALRFLSKPKAAPAPAGPN